MRGRHYSEIQRETVYERGTDRHKEREREREGGILYLVMAVIKILEQSDLFIRRPWEFQECSI